MDLPTTGDYREGLSCVCRLDELDVDIPHAAVISWSIVYAN